MLKTLKILTTIIFTLATFEVISQETDNVKLANEYYTQGEIEKAKELYRHIARDLSKVSLIHNNYFFLLTSTGDYDKAEKYIDRLIKRFPGNINYRLDYGILLLKSSKQGAADKYFNQLIDEIKANNFLAQTAANYFADNQLFNYASNVLVESRETLGNNTLYSLQLANIYRLSGNRDLMVSEYLNYLTTNPSNVRIVKNTLQKLLTEDEELRSLESILYDRIQDEPDNVLYTDLLIWVNLQLNNFYGAFIQARAFDRRTKKTGDKTLEIGIISLNNNDHQTAEKAFNYVIDNFPGTGNHVRAKMNLIKAYELQVKNTYPISKKQIRSVINDYNRFINELGLDRNTLEAIRNKALLHAFYLDEKDSAIIFLNKVIEFPRADKNLVAKSKLDLGDIYLLKGEYWESTLLYSQVEKEMKNTVISYSAKLRNAKLSYYKGDFLLAQEHLDIIKQATSREISNDAISLSLLIKDNITLDSVEIAMREYAAVELLLFQNKNEKALQKLDSLKSNFPSHTLTDEINWLEADIEMKAGNFKRSLELLNNIFINNGDDILGDDAYFRMAEIHERHLGNPLKAEEIYFDFMKRYPGSVLSAEARKRYRILRGDNDENPVN